MKLPLMSGREVVKALSRIGFYVVRQRGSHIRLYHHDREGVTVPNHKELDKGTLNGILADAGISAEEFIGLL